MEEQFWQSLWSAGDTAFHKDAPHPLLTRHFSALGLKAGAHVFVPLCGASVDLDWLIGEGLQVTGIEFNRGAIDQVFERLSLRPDISTGGGLTRLQAGALTLWHGDFFALQASDLPAVSAVYDRAALVALPPDTRAEYARYLTQITANAPTLLISFDFGPSHTDGPPFSVPEAAIRALYATTHGVSLLESVDSGGEGAKRGTRFEQVWHLTRHI